MTCGRCKSWRGTNKALYSTLEEYVEFTFEAYSMEINTQAPSKTAIGDCGLTYGYLRVGLCLSAC